MKPLEITLTEEEAEEARAGAARLRALKFQKREGRSKSAPPIMTKEERYAKLCEWEKIRKEACKTIDVATCDVFKGYAVLDDPYNIGHEVPPEYQCVGKVHYVCGPNSNGAICNEDWDFTPEQMQVLKSRRFVKRTAGPGFDFYGNVDPVPEDERMTQEELDDTARSGMSPEDLKARQAEFDAMASENPHQAA